MAGIFGSRVEDDDLAMPEIQSGLSLPKTQPPRRRPVASMEPIGQKARQAVITQDMMKVLDEPEQPAPEAKPAPKERTWGEAAEDVRMSFSAGAGGLAESTGSLAGLVTGDMDNAVRNLGKDKREWYNSRKSDYLKSLEKGRSDEISKADGIAGKAYAAAKETLINPALLVSFAAEQLPMLVPGFGAGKLVQSAAWILGLGKAASATLGVGGAVAGGAALQGGDVGGQTFDELQKIPLQGEVGKRFTTELMMAPTSLWDDNEAYRANIAKGMSPDEARRDVVIGLARQSGTIGAAVSGFMQLLPGGRVIERALVGKAVGPGGVLRRGLAGAAGETLPEALEEGGGQLSSNTSIRNVDPSRPLTEGVGEAMGLGALGGAALGGTAGLLSPGQQATPGPPAPPEADPNAGGAPPMSEDAEPAEWDLARDPTPPQLPGPAAPAALLEFSPEHVLPEIVVGPDGQAVPQTVEEVKQRQTERQRLIDLGLTPDIAALLRKRNNDGAGALNDTENHLVERFTEPRVLPGDVLSHRQRPFALQTVAQAAASRSDGVVVPVEGGYVVRHPDNFSEVSSREDSGSDGADAPQFASNESLLEPSSAPVPDGAADVAPSPQIDATAIPQKVAGTTAVPVAGPAEVTDVPAEESHQEQDSKQHAREGRKQRARERWSRNVRLDPDRDSLAAAIGKLGGIDRDMAVAMWGFGDGELTHPSSIVGRPLFRAKGGLSPEAMEEALAERGYLTNPDDFNELSDKLAATFRGEPQYTAQGIGYRAQLEQEALAAEEDARQAGELASLGGAIRGAQGALRDLDGAALNDLLERANDRNREITDEQLDALRSDGEQIESGERAAEAAAKNPVQPGESGERAPGEDREEDPIAEGTAEPQRTASTAEVAGPVEARIDALLADPRTEKLKVKVRALVVETKAEATYSEPARTALADVRSRLEFARQVRACLNS
jgi:hypothetical protein